MKSENGLRLSLLSLVLVFFFGLFRRGSGSLGFSVSRQARSRRSRSRKTRDLRYLLLLPLMLLLPSLSMHAQQLQSQTPQPSSQLSTISQANLTQTLQLLKARGFLLLTKLQLQYQINLAVKSASDEAVKQTVATWRPKFDASQLDLKNAKSDDFKWGIGGVIIGAATVAVIKLFWK